MLYYPDFSNSVSDELSPIVAGAAIDAGEEIGGYLARRLQKLGEDLKRAGENSSYTETDLAMGRIQILRDDILDWLNSISEAMEDEMHTARGYYDHV